MNIIPIRQNDPRWGDLLIGDSDLKMSDWGCTLTDISMMLRQFTIFRDPGEVMRDLHAVGGLTPGGAVIWDAIYLAYPRARVHRRWETTLANPKFMYRLHVEEAYKRIRRLIEIGMPTLVYVDAYGNDKRPDHWLLAYELVPDDLVVADPAIGEVMKFSERCGDPRENIHGFCETIGETIGAPIGGDVRIGAAAQNISEAIEGRDVQRNLTEALDSLLSS